MKSCAAVLLALILMIGCGCTAEEMNRLEGNWSVGGITYKDKIVDVRDVDSIADLYDTTFLWFDGDGSFGYMNFYHHSGSCVHFQENSYLLKVESSYRFKTGDNGIEKEEIETEKQTTYLIEFVGDNYTLRFGILDPFTGKIRADDSPLYFVKDGCESSYIAEHKAVVSSGKSSASSSSNTCTVGQSNALKQAKRYLDVMPFSYEGLIEQLEYEGYSYTEAVYGADQCGADWYDQAARAARNYLEIMPFSRSGLIDQLEYDGYTYDQAVYGVTQNGY